jgi:hypothetical protein
LLSPSKDGKPPLTIEHRIFTDDGVTNYYDDEAKDFGTWTGSWKTVQRIGPFASREEATEYMVNRRTPVAVASGQEQA